MASTNALPGTTDWRLLPLRAQVRWLDRRSRTGARAPRCDAHRLGDTGTEGQLVHAVKDQHHSFQRHADLNQIQRGVFVGSAHRAA